MLLMSCVVLLDVLLENERNVTGVVVTADVGARERLVL